MLRVGFSMTRPTKLITDLILRFEHRLTETVKTRGAQREGAVLRALGRCGQHWGHAPPCFSARAGGAPTATAGPQQVPPPSRQCGVAGALKREHAQSFSAMRGPLLEHEHKFHEPEAALRATGLPSQEKDTSFLRSPRELSQRGRTVSSRGGILKN